jgi:hypothetical protein
VMQLMGQPVMNGDVISGILCASNTGLQDRMYCTDRHEEFLKFVTLFRINFYLLLECNGT